MLRNVTVLFVLFLAAQSSFAQIRTWRDNTGKFTIEAEFVDVADGKVRLQKADGSLIAVPLERLSEADRRHAQSLATTSGEATKSASKPESMTKKRATTGRTRNDQSKSGRESIERTLDDRADLPQGDTSLKDMIHQLAAHHQIAILLDVKALDDTGIPANVKVTVREKGATLEATLNGSLKPMNLAWAVDHDVLAITTQEGAESCLETVVYKLLQPADGVALLRDLGAKIEPKNWDNVGGAGSRVAWPGGALVISQNSTGHRQIAKQYAAALKRLFPGETRTTTRGKPSPLARPTAPVTCEYVEVPLGQVVADLSKQSGVAVTLDADALRDVGIGTDTPVTFALQGASLASSLKWLLRPLGLVWIPDKAGLKVTTAKAEGAALQIVTYDVRDLLMAARGSGDSLVDLVSTVIAPATWQSVGGPGTISSAVGGLQVKQTYRIHCEIEELLTGLRQASRS